MTTEVGTGDSESARSFAWRLSYEVKMWLLAVLKMIPGRIGCAIRAALLPGTYGANVLIWDRVHLDEPAKLRVGARTSINRGSILHCAGGIAIGEDVLIGPEVIIYSQNHVFKDRSRLIREQGYDQAPVTIGRDVWIAARAIILPGVNVGTGAVVAAGAVVSSDVAPYSVVAGVPARPIGLRQET